MFKHSWEMSGGILTRSFRIISKTSFKYLIRFKLPILEHLLKCMDGSDNFSMKIGNIISVYKELFESWLAVSCQLSVPSSEAYEKIALWIFRVEFLHEEVNKRFLLRNLFLKLEVTCPYELSWGFKVSFLKSIFILVESSLTLDFLRAAGTKSFVLRSLKKSILVELGTCWLLVKVEGVILLMKS